MSIPFHNPLIETRFEAFTNQSFALKMRSFIYSTAKNLGVHAIEESLKWNQPSYLAKGGTAIRIAEQGERIAYLVSCQTSIIEDLKEKYPDEDFDKTRGLYLDLNKPISEAAESLIHAALLYKTK